MKVEFQISGLTFRQKDDERTLHLKPHGLCEVIVEPDNKYDPLALRVHHNQVFIGFIPSDKTQEKKGLPLVQSEIHKLINSGEKFTVEAYSYCYRDDNGWNNDDHGVLGAVTLLLCTGSDIIFPDEDIKKVEKPVQTNPGASEQRMDAGCVKLKSFNEGIEVDFYPEKHIYMYEGKELKSVTRLVKSMYPDFDKWGIAQKCAMSWGMSAEQIVDMWNINAESASSLGTAIHAAMQNYCKYGERGLSKMPLLREVVQSFPWDGCESHTEVLLTCVQKGICGTADRLDVHDGVIMVCDYKCNTETEKASSSHKNRLYPKLRQDKVGKCVAQLSIYADMLERSGFKVDDEVCDHVWVGSWTHFVEPRIKGILEKVTG